MRKKKDRKKEQEKEIGKKIIKIPGICDIFFIYLFFNLF